MGIGNLIKAKEQAKHKAICEWHKAIKDALSDGQEKPINDEDDDEFEGAIEWVGSGQYVFDRIKWNESHNDFKLRGRLITPKGLDEPIWILGCCVEHGGLDGLLEKIIWD